MLLLFCFEFLIGSDLLEPTRLQGLVYKENLGPRIPTLGYKVPFIGRALSQDMDQVPNLSEFGTSSLKNFKGTECFFQLQSLNK